MTPIQGTTSTLYLSQDEALPPDVASSLYAFVDRPSRALVLRNRSLARIQVVGGRVAPSSLPIYLYNKAPCTYATIAGIVVAVTERDRRWDLMIDDGTQIIDANIHSRWIPDSLLIEEPLSVPSTSRLTLDSSSISSLSTLAIQAGDIVKITGKIWRRQWTASRRRTSFKVGLDVQSCQLLNHDPTEEARHNLKAHVLASTEYAQAFAMPSEAVSMVRIVLPPQSEEAALNCSPDEALRMERKFNDDLRALVGFRTGITDEAGLRVRSVLHCRSASKRSYSVGLETEVGGRSLGASQSKLMRTEGQAFVCGPTIVSLPPPTYHDTVLTSRNIKNEPKWSEEADLLLPDTAPTSREPSPRPFASQGFTPSQESGQGHACSFAPHLRQLRNPSKLRDSQCTVDLFRLHVQKFLTDHDRFATLCEQAAASKRSGHHQDRHCAPPVFSIHFLMTVKSLWELADRVVGVMIRSREKACARKGVLPPTSGEPKSEKMKRLFERCVRQLVNEGYVVIAASPDVASEQSNGPSSRSHFDRAGAIILEAEADTSDDSNNSLTAVEDRSRPSLHPSLQFEIEKWQRQFYKAGGSNSRGIGSHPSLAPPPSPPPPPSVGDAQGGRDSYQLLTPSLLIPPLTAILRRSSSSSFIATHKERLTATMNEEDVANLAKTLKGRDDRWKFVADQSVKEALVEMTL